MRTSSARLLISPATSLYQSTAPKQARTRHACQSAAWRGRGSSCCRRDQRGARAVRSVDRDRSAAAFCFWSSLDESNHRVSTHVIMTWSDPAASQSKLAVGSWLSKAVAVGCDDPLSCVCVSPLWVVIWRVVDLIECVAELSLTHIMIRHSHTPQQAHAPHTQDHATAARIATTTAEGPPPAAATTPAAGVSGHMHPGGRTAAAAGAAAPGDGGAGPAGAAAPAAVAARWRGMPVG